MLCPDCGYTYFSKSKKCASCGANIRQTKTHLELAQESAFAIFEGEGYAPAGIGDEEAYEHYGVEDEAEEMIVEEGEYGEVDEMATTEGYFTDIGPDDFELDLSEAIGDAGMVAEEYGEGEGTMDYAADTIAAGAYEGATEDYAYEADTDTEAATDEDVEGIGLGFEEPEAKLDLGDDAGEVELDLGGDDAGEVELDLGEEDAGGVELDLGEEDAGGVELDLGEEDAGGVELDLGEEDAGGVELDLGGDDAGEVELDLGGEGELDLGDDLDLGGEPEAASGDDDLDLDLDIDGLELDLDTDEEEKE